MKKSLIALAVAGAFAAPAFAATSNVDVYGIMNVAVQDLDVDGSDMQVTDNFSRIGFKGSEDLGGGLKAVWQIETGLGSGSDGMGTSDIATRNTFIGLAGGFGTVLAGRHDTPYKIATGKYDIFGDTIADYNLGRLDNVQLINNPHDHRSPSAIAYISPNFSGFTVAAAVVSTNNEGSNAVVASATPATATSLDNDDTFDAYSLALMYANGPLTVDVGYQDVGVIDSSAWKIGVGYSFGDIKLGFVYEDVENFLRSITPGIVDPDANISNGLDRDSWIISASYTMGAIVLKAQYGQADVDTSATVTADQDMWAIGADYNLSKRTTAYFVYGNGDDDSGDDVSGWTIGMKHSF